MNISRAMRRGYTHKKIFNVFILSPSGDKVREWEIVQYHKNFNTLTGSEVDYIVQNKKGFFSGRTMEDVQVSITCEGHNMLIVEEMPIQEI